MAFWPLLKRVKRDAGEPMAEELRNTCIMLIHVDHMFTSRFKKCPKGKESPRCPVDREEVLAFISSHIKAINNIYMNKAFELNDGTGKKIRIRPRFQVTTVTIVFREHLSVFIMGKSVRLTVGLKYIFSEKKNEI